MAQLRQDYPEFIKRNTEIIAVAPDNAAILKDFWSKEQVPFIGVPDLRHKVADSYYQEVNVLKFGRMPALFVIDKQGIVRFRHYSDSMSDIVPDEQLFQVLDTIISEESLL
jgi:peroxiredoxin